MSWLNPSQDEAEREYSYAKRKYTEAAERKRSSQLAEERYISEKSRAQNEINSCRNDKINFEKRVRDIEQVIGCFEGNNFFIDIPGSVDKHNSAAEKAGESFSGCIKCMDIAAADISRVFRCRTVSEDSNSSSALSDLKKEKTRLEQAIENLKAQMANLSGVIDTLSSQIRACNAEQASCTRQMFSSSYDMNHYKRYM